MRVFRPAAALLALTTALLMAPAATAAAPAPSAAIAGGATAPGATAPSATATATKKIAVYPSPGTLVASDRTQISFVGLAPKSLGRVFVVGSRSGRHAGRRRAHTGRRGVSFIPRRPFVANERVTVRTKHPVYGGGRKFSFAIGNFNSPAAKPSKNLPPEGDIPPQATKFHSRPDLMAPVVNVETPAAPTVAPGYIFMSPKLNGPMIVDNEGELVYYRPGIETADFKAQSYRGKPVITWWQGPFNTGGYTEGIFVIANPRYRVIERVRAGNGYRGDLHEFQLTARGTAYIPAYRAVVKNLSRIGGPKRAAVLDSVVQEIDVRTGLVVWEWHSMGNVGLKESMVPVPKTPDQAFDYFHINSINEDADGNVLISARNTSAAYKVSKRTGRVLWRLNGTNPSFTPGPGTETDWQHDFQPRPDGTYTIFDNASAPPVREQSRGLVIRPDLERGTAELVRSYSHPDGVLTSSQGNMQTLPNGNVMIGWGSEPYMTEFSQDGEVLFDANYAARNSSYRIYRMPWVGLPKTRPAIASRAVEGEGVRVWASWNGDTRTRAWRLLAGPSRKGLKPVIEVERDGFETGIAIPSADGLPPADVAPGPIPAAAARFVAVVALNDEGEPISRSAVTPVG